MNRRFMQTLKRLLQHAIQSPAHFGLKEKRIIPWSDICSILRPLIHFDASRGLTPTVTFVDAILVPSMVVAPKENAGPALETSVELVPDGGVVELFDGSLLQPTITMVAEMNPMMMAFFIMRHAAWL